MSLFSKHNLAPERIFKSLIGTMPKLGLGWENLTKMFKRPTQLVRKQVNSPQTGMGVVLSTVEEAEAESRSVFLESRMNNPVYLKWVSLS